MENVISSSKKVSKAKIFIIVLIAFVAIGVVSHYGWKGAGSGQWELAYDEDGMKVWTKKDPGEVLLKAKGTVRINAKLSPIMKFMRDPASCDDVGCYDSRIVDDSRGPELLYYTFKYDVFFPFKPRVFMVKSEFTQDPITKEMNIGYVSASDEKILSMMPANDADCCVRVDDMKNHWKFTPVGNGDVEVEFLYDTGMGGNMPYAMLNLGVVPVYTDTFLKLRETMSQERYRIAKVDYVQEVDEVSEPSALETQPEANDLDTEMNPAKLSVK